MQNTHSLLVFTDLDGTLLDHQTYDWSPAAPALARLAKLGAPVILASSKTAAEIEPLQAELGLSGYPAIVENGAGLFCPNTKVETEPNDYSTLRAIIEDIPPELRKLFIGFGDMSIDDLIAHTNLPANAAQRAQKREYSEPGIWSGTCREKDEFLELLKQKGVSDRQGGRFLTLSFGGTKRDRMDEISTQFAANVIVALGDAPNDLEMLENSDYGFIVTNPHSSSLPHLIGESKGRVVRTDLPGPEGWNAAMNDFLNWLDKNAARNGRV